MENYNVAMDIIQSVESGRRLKWCAEYYNSSQFYFALTVKYTSTLWDDKVYYVTLSQCDDDVILKVNGNAVMFNPEDWGYEHNIRTLRVLYNTLEKKLDTKMSDLKGLYL